MQILIISEDYEFKEKSIKLFSGNYVEERGNVSLVNSLDEAQSFIQKDLVERQKHIDFIFIDSETSDFLLQAERFGKQIRESIEDYSSHNFQLKSLPLILYKDDGHNEFNNSYSEIMLNDNFG